MNIIPPKPEENFGFFDYYVKKFTDNKDLFTVLDETRAANLAVFEGLDETMLEHRYAENKWSIREVLQHLIDSERNFNIRAMRFSRGDQALLPGYDVHSFVANSLASRRSKEDLLEEWDLMRRATKLQFKGFDENMLDLTGPARDTVISVRSIGFIIAGHENHHVNVVKEKYLGQAVS